MRGRYWIMCVATAGLLCGSAVAQQEVLFDFESPTYGTGDLDGQDGWLVTRQDGGAALIIDTDNGPGGPGSQCLELNVLDGYIDPNDIAHCHIDVERWFDDLVVNGGPLITLEYDVRWLVDDPNDNSILMWLGFDGAGLAHWWSLWCQRLMVKEPLGTESLWPDGYPWRGYSGQWNTIKWTFIYGDMGDDQGGQLMRVDLDEDTDVPNHNYLPWTNIPYEVNHIYFHLRDGYNGPYTFDDRFLIDNLRIRGEPLPSAVPVADAGPDVTQDPGSWDGVVLDGSGSSDDGEIVRYRWTVGYGWDAPMVYDGTEAAPLVDLDTGVYELVLTVFDDDGLRDTDTAVYTIGDRPAILDEVAGPWGIRNADIYGTGASNQITINTSMGAFEVVEQILVNDPWWGTPTEGDNLVFDRFGNIYYLTWNELLESWDKTLNYRWRANQGGAQKTLGGDVGHNTVIAGIRYIYAVGGDRSDEPNEPRAYAFKKSTGELVWETYLDGEDWSGQPGRPKVTLYDDKLYIVGETVSSYVNVFQVDATSGHLDWSSSCLVEMQYLMDNNVGSPAFIPDAFGAGLHGLVWNQMSDIPDFAWFDGYADIAALMIDPDPDTGGATPAWNVNLLPDAPGLNTSHPIYSPTTGLVYTPSFYYDWSASFYAWDVHQTDGLYGSYTFDDPNDAGDHGFRDNFVLDFDGLTVHAPGPYDSIYSYTDNLDTTYSVEYRDYGGELEHGWGFAAQGCLLQDQNGHSIFITATEPYVDPNDPNQVVPTKIVAVDLSEPAGPDSTPIAEWVAGEWDAGNERWTWYMPYAGPTPGPDGSIYIIQNDWDWWYGQSRITRLRFVPPSGCDGDVDGDGDTDHSDLGALLAAWGSQPGDPNWNPGADLDGSGEVGHSDLGILLGDWGCGVP